MASPVTSDSVPQITGSMQSCAAFKALLQSVRELSSLADWLFDDDGLPSVDIAREFGSIIFPPGSVMDVVVGVGETHANCIKQIEKMWLTVEEKAAYDADRNSVQPFWVLADHEGKSGAPNLSGRFRLMADFRDIDDGNVSGVAGVDFQGGSKDHKLTEDELAAHTHPLVIPQAEGTQADPLAGRFLYTPKDDGGIPGSGDLATWPNVTLEQSTGGDKAHNNMPPYHVILTAYRTTRVT